MDQKEIWARAILKALEQNEDKNLYIYFRYYHSTDIIHALRTDLSEHDFLLRYSSISHFTTNWNDDELIELINRCDGYIHIGKEETGTFTIWQSRNSDHHLRWNMVG